MSDGRQRTWTFLTNHARVLILIAENPGIRLRDIAARAGITERASQRIVAELEAEAYLTHEKVGRRNYYRLLPSTRLRHPLENGIEVGQLLDLFVDRQRSENPPEAS
jgi:DNA-binding IclR family transcriptional regulator